MELLASADHHFQEGSRFDECVRVHSWIAETVEARRPDAFLSAGDIYERVSTPCERAAVADFLIRIAEVCPVVVTRGNHDALRDTELLGRLRARHPIHVIESCGVVRVGGWAIGCMAWPSKSSLAAMIGKPLSQQALDEEARDCMRDVLRGLGEQLSALADGPEQCVPVLLGHWMIDGSVTSTGQPLIGAELRVGLDDLALANADIVIAGHIHKPQAFDYCGKPILYCGSPYRTAYGELEEKSILRIQHDASGLRWERLPTPASAMLLVEAEWNGHRMELLSA